MVDQKSIETSFVKSLLWLALSIIIAASVGTVVELVFVDFIHGNPHRSQQNAAVMMFLFPPIGGVIIFVGVMLVFGIPQICQAVIAKILVRKFGYFGVAGLLVAVPITTLLTWYCFDYLTPSNYTLAINAGADWVPYQHGLTLKRYFIMLVMQSAVTIFTIVQFLTLQTKTQRVILSSLIGLAIISGSLYGYHMALGQYKFL